MRIFIALFTLASFFSACNGGKKEDLKTDVQTVSPDSTYNNSALTDTGKSVITEAPAVVKETAKPVVKPTPKPVVKQDAPVYDDNMPTGNSNTNTGTTTTAPASTGSQTSAGSTTATPEVKEKKGMSNA